jgi:hypothetical protein
MTCGRAARSPFSDINVRSCGDRSLDDSTAYEGKQQPIADGILWQV